MLTPTPHQVPIEIIKQIISSNKIDFGKQTINEPTGNFFYDPWILKDEFKNTIWEEILNTLPNPIGEARIITLKQSEVYVAHCDIDDRYHLNLQGENSYLFDLDEKIIHSLSCDGMWYYMDAGKLHSAANLGAIPRIQLVVRKLLRKNNLKQPLIVNISSKGTDSEDNRYYFDQHLSKWLNRANKNGTINSFEFDKKNNLICLLIEEECISEFDSVFPHDFYSYNLKYEN